MKYYGVYNIKGIPDDYEFHSSKIIGYHESKRVCEKYLNQLVDSHEFDNSDLKIISFKGKVLKTITAYYDLYLVRYGNGYIQSKFMDLVEYDYKTSIQELMFAKEIIMKYLEFSDASDSTKKHAMKTYQFLDKIQEDIKNDIPSLNTLTQMEIERECKMLASSRWGINVDDASLWE